jgi:hypothetical protein
VIHDPAVQDKLTTMLFSHAGTSLCDDCLAGSAGVTVPEAVRIAERLANFPAFVRERGQCGTCRALAAVTSAR